MIVLQIAAILFGIFMIYVVRIHRLKRNLEPFEAGAWYALWAVFILLALIPETITGMIQNLHILSSFEFLVILALMIIVYITLRNYIAYRKLERKLEDLIRKRALDEKKRS